MVKNSDLYTQSTYLLEFSCILPGLLNSLPKTRTCDAISQDVSHLYAMCVSSPASSSVWTERVPPPRDLQTLSPGSLQATRCRGTCSSLELVEVLWVKEEVCRPHLDWTAKSTHLNVGILGFLMRCEITDNRISF